VARVNRELRRLLTSGRGVVTRAQVLARVPRWVLEHAVGSGALVRAFPQVYIARPADPAALRRAALAFCGGQSVLSHLTALAAWGLHRPEAGEPVHITVPESVRLRSPAGLVVHRRREPSPSVPRGGLPVTRLEVTLVAAWPLLPAGERRAVVIEAVGRRMTTPERVSAALAEVPRLPGRRELRLLLDRLAAGCRSPLEIWGLEHVFAGPGMPEFVRQHPVRLGRRTVYLDGFAPVERVAFELDGEAWHGAPWHRERDLRRDALLATRGIVVVRYGYRRLVGEPDQVRREVLAILAAHQAPEGPP